jgi:hypothetical protein
VVLVCLRTSPDARFASAVDLLRALEEARTHLMSVDHGRQAGPSPREGHAIWWWQFHQAAATLGYLLLLIPLWRVRDVPPASSGTLLFVAGLVGVVTASVLRWHSWFSVRLDPADWHDQHGRSRRWILAGDALFVVILVSVGAFSLLAERLWGILLLAAAAAVLVSFAIIEPATARAALTSVPVPQRRQRSLH